MLFTFLATVIPMCVMAIEAGNEGYEGSFLKRMFDELES